MKTGFGLLAALALLVSLSPQSKAEETEPLTRRIPSGPLAYVEVTGLKDRVTSLLESPLYRAIADHPSTKSFLASPQGQKAIFAQNMLQGFLGLDVPGLLKAVGAGRLGIALYGEPGATPRPLALVEMDPVLARKIVGALEFARGAAREVVVPADDRGGELIRVGPAYIGIEQTLTFVTTDEAIARRVRTGEGETLAASGRVAEARKLVDGEPLVFAFVDVRKLPVPAGQAGTKAEDFGKALLLGALPHDVRSAPYAALALDLRVEEDEWIVRAQARVPATGERPDAWAALGGTLGDLPFALPKETIGVVRLKRDLAGMWEHQADLIVESALPQLVKFDQNFKQLTGLAFTEELLPRLGHEVAFVAARRTWGDGEKAPEIQLPHLALIWPVRTDDRIRQSFELAFQQALSVLGLQQSEMSRKLLVMREEYAGVAMMTARYPDPSEGEMQGRTNLPIRYNFTPSAAVVGDHYVVASTRTMLRSLIDGRAGRTAAPAGRNAGIWLQPGPGVAMLRANRSALVAQRMLKEGEEHAAAERSVDLVLEIAGLLRDFAVTVDEGRDRVGASLRLVVGAPAK